MFEPLRHPARFAEVRADPQLGTVVWPNEADLDPDVLYHRATGAALPGWDGTPGTDGSAAA